MWKPDTDPTEVGSGGGGGQQQKGRAGGLGFLSPPRGGYRTIGASKKDGGVGGKAKGYRVVAGLTLYKVRGGVEFWEVVEDGIYLVYSICVMWEDSR